LITKDVLPVRERPQRSGVEEAHPHHEAADDEHGSGNHRQHEDQAQNQSECHPTPAAKIDQTWPKRTAHGGVATSSQDPAQQRHDAHNDEQRDAGKHDCIRELRNIFQVNELIDQRRIQVG
jgi:hypothetical protein